MLLLPLAASSPFALAAEPSLPETPYARYHADEGVTLNASGTVTRWHNQTGSAERDLNRIIGTPKTAQYSHNQGETSEVISLDGSSAIWAASADWGVIASSRTVAVRARLKGNLEGFLFDGSTAAGKSRARVVNGMWQVGVQRTGVSWGAGDQSTTTAAGNIWQTHLFEFEESGTATTVRHWINGTDVGGGGTIAFKATQGGLIVGMNGGSANGLEVEIAEIVVYDRLLSAEEKSQTTDYFDQVWGDLYEAPLEFASATVVQRDADVSRFGAHGVAALVVTSQGNIPSAGYALGGLTFNLEGTTDLADIESILVYYGGASSRFDTGNAVLLASATPAAGPIEVALDQVINERESHFWIVAKTRRSAAVGHVLDAAITSFHFVGETPESRTPTLSSPPEKLTIRDIPFSNILHARGQNGVGYFRIPGLVVTNEGTLIASFDIRHGGSAPDLPADIDVGIRRSTDGGLSWTPVQVIMDKDKNAPGSQGNGIADPSLLVDRLTGRIWCAALWSFGNRGWNGSGPGLEPSETGQFLLNYSDDDGQTWTEPVSITSQIKKPEWHLYFQGPGKGICTRDGTLIYPAQFRDANRVARSNFIYSLDRGATWNNVPAAVPTGNFHTNEAQIVELDDGNLLLSMKNFDSRKERLWCIYSWDHETQTIAEGSWGQTWFSQNDPTVMASVERYHSVLDGHPFSALLFSNPDSKAGRERMSVRVSFDEGHTWPYKRKIDDRPAAYSCMAVLPDGDIGMLYETGDGGSIEDLTFVRFPFEWVTGTADTDGDGIPDYYEDATGLDKNDPSDAALDADGDGQSNLFEYRAKTNLNDPTSRFEVKSTKMSEDSSSIRLGWTAMPYATYQIQSSPDLTPESWSVVAGLSQIPAAPHLRNLEVDLTMDAPNRKFFRVALLDSF